MLDAMNDVGELLDVATLVDNTRLVDDATAIESLVNKVCGNAKKFYTIVYCILDSMCTLERGQQRGVDVHDALLIALQEHLAHNAHISRQADEVHIALVEHRSQHRLVGLTRAILLGVESEALCAVALCALKNISTWLIAHQKHNLGIYDALATRLGNGLIVAATAAGKYCQSCLSHSLDDSYALTLNYAADD